MDTICSSSLLDPEWQHATLFDASLLTPEPPQSGSFFFINTCMRDRPVFGYVVNYGLAGLDDDNDVPTVSVCVRKRHEKQFACPQRL